MNVAIQPQVLNVILTNKNPGFISNYNLDESFFSDYINEYRFITNHIKEYGNIPDKESFLSKFPNFAIIQVNETDNYLIKELYKDKKTRQLSTAFNKVRDYIMQDKVDDAFRVLVNSVDNISDSVNLEAVDILSDTQRLDDYESKINNFSNFYVTTGFTELDEAIGGWDRTEELATLVARTGKGKTWILLKCAEAAAKAGLRVGLYSGEMSVNKVGYRVDTLISHISNGSLLHGNEDVRVEYENYMKNLPNMYKGNIFVFTPEMIGSQANVPILGNYIDKYNLDMLCIDQHSLLDDVNHARNPVESAANISKDLKKLQVMKRIPIIAVCQQNRESTDSGIDTTHIAQTDRIGQDSTTILFFENDKDQGNGTNILTITMAKCRDSVNGKKLKYIVDLNRGIFEYIPEQNDLTNGVHSEELRQDYGEDDYYDAISNMDNTNI